MISSQNLIIAVLVATMGMFLWGKWRHDMVALGALLVCVFVGLVPGREAFAEFGHPAVITVACLLILGHGPWAADFRRGGCAGQAYCPRHP